MIAPKELLGLFVLGLAIGVISEVMGIPLWLGCLIAGIAGFGCMKMTDQDR